MGEISSRIEVCYPPSPAHLELFLSMIRTYKSSGGAQFDTKATLDASPTLIVVHEPSAYFLDPETETLYTASSYISLVAQALASLTFLSAHNDGTEHVIFALFDSQLERLKLPVIRPPAGIFHDQEEDTGQFPRLESVAGLVQKYFEWVGVSDKQDSANEQEDGIEHKRKNRLRLYQTAHLDENHSMVWHWIEHDGPERGTSDKRGIVFSCT